ncbi:hypothetical protein WSM22_35830 [Cytophagales bacterium WSM2-2]|nr:hypothetical protein WSM22_35830 [Cytophagales bacterium WSM2-2]
MRKAKKISIGARYSDKGMLVLNAQNEAEVKSLILKDIAVQNKLFKVEIFPFNTFYKGCIE